MKLRLRISSFSFDLCEEENEFAIVYGAEASKNKFLFF